MRRKRRFSKLLLFAAMVSTIGAGVLGSVPLTANFEPYEGTCETESVTVPKGESIILPDASYEGHYLESWIEVVENGNVHWQTPLPVLHNWYPQLLPHRLR